MPAKSRRPKKVPGHPFKNKSGEWDLDAVFEILLERVVSKPYGMATLLAEGYGEDADGQPWVLPDAPRIYAYMHKTKGAMGRWLEAKSHQAHVLNDSILDDVEPQNYPSVPMLDRNGKPVYIDGSLVRRVDRESISIQALKVKVKGEQAARLAPAYYNPTTKVEHSGSVDVNQIKEAVQGEGTADIKLG